MDELEVVQLDAALNEIEVFGETYVARSWAIQEGGQLNGCRMHCDIPYGYCIDIPCTPEERPNNDEVIFIKKL